MIAERDAGRSKIGYHTVAAVDEFDRIIRAETPHLGLWLDSSNLTVTETVDYILTNLAQVRVQVKETA